MKNNTLKSVNKKGLMLTIMLCLCTVTYTYANRWFGKESEPVADQYAYGDTCYHVSHVKTYFFGIVVNEEMVYTPFQCGPGHE